MGILQWIESHWVQVGVLWGDFHDLLFWGAFFVYGFITHNKQKKHKIKIADLQDTVAEFQYVHDEINSLNARVEELEGFEKKIKTL